MHVRSVSAWIHRHTRTEPRVLVISLLGGASGPAIIGLLQGMTNALISHAALATGLLIR